MNKKILHQLTPHFAALLLFIVISFAYFNPVLEGKQLLGHDTQSWMYMANETVTYNSTHSQPTLWTDSMFGGMPTYQISMTQPNNLLSFVDRVIHIFPAPVVFLILYLIGFYILLLAFGINPWLSIVGSFAFTFASYNFIIIAAGHNSKAYTIAYMAPLIGSVYLAFRDKKLLGSLLTAFFLSLTIRANHIQIIYYTLIILLLFGIVEFIYSIKNKKINSFLRSAGLLLVAFMIGLGMNATTLLTTYDYSQYTMRGKSDGLTSDEQNSQQGLNKDYITQWSYGIGETMTVLIPDFRGGASVGTLDANSNTARKLESMGVSDVSQMMKDTQLPLYWGDQPGTSGPVYFGAIICFLFVMGIFLVDRKIKWWLIPMIVLTLMLSWGKNFMGLTDLFINYFPMYNKFRTVSMMLVATGFGVALMAALALKKIFDPQTDKSKLIRPLMISAAITGGLALIFALFPGLAGNFVSAADEQFKGNYAFLKETLPLDREAMLRSDAIRSVLFILFGAGILWLYLKNYLKEKVAYVLLAAVILFDLVPVAKRYLSDKDFIRKIGTTNPVEPSKADQMILQDTSDYRVLNATVDIFQDASPSYFHKNIGGYHAAKLRRYQELINMQLTPEIGRLFGAFAKAKTFNDLTPTLDSLGVLNMLNMKYIIYNKDAAPLVNPYANGNAWFVDSVVVAQNANQEMDMLGKINTKKTLVVDKEYASLLPSKLIPDSTSKIRLIKYEPNRLTYSFSSTTNQLAVFSEIYYPSGWNVYIRGERVPYFRADFLLRAMPLKAGVYEVEFRFEPKSYSTGNTIALISSILLLIWVGGYVYVKIKKKPEIPQA